MIIGIGVDITEIIRVKKIIEQPVGERFLDRILTASERELLRMRKGRTAEFAAGRFAAKEAVAKALGCGIGKQVGFRDVEVLPDASGKPICTLLGDARRRAGLDPDALIHISISHSETTAIAYVVIESRG